MVAVTLLVFALACPIGKLANVLGRVCRGHTGRVEEQSDQAVVSRCTDEWIL